MEQELTQEEWQEELKWAYDNGEISYANEVRGVLNLPPIDQSGASFGDRTAASASRGPGAEMAALQNRHGAENVTPFGQDNYLLNNQQLFNPPGFDAGDLAQFMRPAAEAGGALIGGAAGIPGGPLGMMLGAGLGGESAGTMYDKGMQHFAGSEDFRQPGDALTDTMMGTAFNSMGGPMVTQSLFSPDMARRAGDDVFGRAMTAANLPPLTPGQMGSTTGKRVEGWLESSATGGRAIDEQRIAVGDSLNRYITDNFPVEMSRDETGRMLTEGAESVIGTKVKATGRYPADSLRGQITSLYAELDRLIKSVDGGTISIPRSQDLLRQVEGQMAKDPDYARLINQDPDLMRYINTLKTTLKELPPETRQIFGEPRIGAAGDRVIPMTEEVIPGTGKEASFPLYDTLKQFRTNVGSKLDDPFMTATGGIDAEKRRLYGVLSEDLAAGADELGGVGAKQARSRADWFNRGVMDRLEKIDPVFKNADNPTKVYDALGYMVMHDPGSLNAVKKTLPESAWDDFSSTYIRRLLSARPGGQNAAGDAVSYGTMATNLNKLKKESPEAWKLIAGDNAEALENIGVIANRFRESERFFNRSNTANATNLGRLATDMVMGGGTGFALSGGNMLPTVAAATTAVTAHTAIPWLTAKVMTSPSIRKAVEKLPTSLLADLASPKKLGRALIAAGADEVEIAELMAMEEAALAAPKTNEVGRLAGGYQ